MLAISAVIPCYNAGPFLAQAIESVLAQSRPPTEVILVDDASTDESGAVAQRYAVRYVRLPSNSGNAVARNRCIQEARCELIAWLDADDYWEPNHLQVVADLLDRYPAAAAAFSTVRLVGDASGFWSPSFPAGEPTNVFWEAFRRTPGPQMSAVTRGSALLQIGGYHEGQRTANDYEFFMRLARFYPFVCTHEVTSNYRRHAHQLSSRPERQYRDTYASRLRLAAQARAEDHEELARQMEECMRWIWESDLEASWKERDMVAVRYFLRFAGLVPGASRLVARRYARRVWLPRTVLRAWDLGPLGTANKIRLRLRAGRATRT